MPDQQWVKQLARELRKPTAHSSEKEPPKPDWWARAGVISSFFSSVVIGTVGLFISSSFQKVQLASTEATARAQIEIARLKNEDDGRLQESRFAADLLQQLLSEEPRHRALAIVMLHRAVAAPMYDEIVTLLADKDPDALVRRAAIQQLGQSKSTQVAVSLSQLAMDSTKPQGERSLASAASTSIAFSNLATGSLLFMAASPGQASFEDARLGGGVFTHFLLEALAKKSSGNQLTPNYLRDFIEDAVPVAAREQGFQQRPYTVFEGFGLDKPLFAEGSKTSALVIGISRYSDDHLMALRSSVDDAQRLQRVLSDKGATVNLLTDQAATCSNIRTKLGEIVSAVNKSSVGEQNDIILYFSGHGWSRNGIGYLACVDTVVEKPDNTAIPIETISRTLAMASSARRILFFDASSVDPFMSK